MAKVQHGGGCAASVRDGEVRLLGPWEQVGPRGAAGAAESTSTAAAVRPLIVFPLLPPIDERSKIICLGLNYRSHVEETAATVDEIPDPRVLRLETRLNGQTVQSTTADLMICDTPAAIEYISRFTPLSPGDVIAMGTPGGVGATHTPPLWMRAGDVIEVSVSGIGTLSNTVHDELPQTR